MAQYFLNTAGLFSKVFYNCYSLSTLVLPVLILTISTVSTETQALDTPTLSPYHATYQSQIKGLEAQLQRSLKATKDQQWQLSNTVNVLFSGFSEQATFRVNGDHVQALTYQYINPISKKRSSELHFDWANKHVIDRKHPQPPLQIPAHAVDKLALQYQIRLDLQRKGQQFKHKEYTVIDRTRLKTYRVEVLGYEKLQTLAGAFNTIKLKQFRPGKNKHTFIWLATDYEYLILRIDAMDKGKRRDTLELKEAILAGKLINPSLTQ